MSDPRTRAVARLVITGMTSVHAARAIFTALAGVEGVTHADVTRGSAIVEHDGRVSDDALREAVALAGFTVTNVTRETRVLPVL